MKKRILSLLCALFLLYTSVIPVYAAKKFDSRSNDESVTDAFLYAVTDSNGTALAPEADGYLLTADGSGTYTLKIVAYSEKNLILAIRGNHGGHSLSLTFSEDGETYRSTSVVSVTLREEETLSYYLIDIPSDMTVTHIRIRLSGTPGAHLHLASVEPPLCVDDYRTDKLGEISSATLEEGNTLSVRGSLDSEASIQYLSYKLVLFALEPTETLSDLSHETTRLEELSVQHKFDFRVRPDATALEKKYVVALVNDEECIPISAPFYAYPQGDSSTQFGYKGVYSDGRIDPFAAGAETAIVDFDLNRLLRPDAESGNTKLYIINGVYYNLDISYMDRIRRTLELSYTCGITSVLHLTGMIQVAEKYTTTAALNALVDFLCEEYGNDGMVSGIILGSDGLDMTSDAEGLANYATMLHFLALLTSTKMRHVAVYGEIHYDNHASEALCQLAAAVHREGNLSYGVFFHTAKMSSTIASELNALADGKSAALPHYYGLLWEVDENIQLSSYHVYATQVKLKFNTFAINASENVNPSLAIERLLSFDKELTHTYINSSAEPPSVYTGFYFLEEFDRNTSSALWHVGDGVQSIGIGYSSLFSHKVLVIHPEQETLRTVAVYKPQASLNLKHAPYVHVSFAVSTDKSSTLSEDGKEITGELIFLSGTSRAVIPLSHIPSNARLDINAYLQDFSGLGKIDAIVLTIEGEDVVEIYVDNITLYSMSSRSEEIPTRIFEGSVHAAEKNDQTPVYLFVGFLLLLTLAVPVLFLRRNKDENK